MYGPKGKQKRVEETRHNRLRDAQGASIDHRERKESLYKAGAASSEKIVKNQQPRIGNGSGIYQRI